MHDSHRFQEEALGHNGGPVRALRLSLADTCGWASECAPMEINGIKGNMISMELRYAARSAKAAGVPSLSRRILGVVKGISAGNASGDSIRDLMVWNPSEWAAYDKEVTSC